MLLTSVVDVVAEAGHQEAEAGDGAEVAPPARGRQRAVHGLGHHEGVPPVVVHNLHTVNIRAGNEGLRSFYCETSSSNNNHLVSSPPACSSS